MNYRMRERMEAGSAGFSLLKGCWMLLALGTVLGMSYLWVYTQVVDVSWELERFEDEMDQLRTRSVALKLQLAKLQNPAVIKDRLKEKEIDLVVPQLDQVIRVRRQTDLSPLKVEPQSPPSDPVILSQAGRID